MLKIGSSGRWEREGGTVLYNPNYIYIKLQLHGAVLLEKLTVAQIFRVLTELGTDAYTDADESSPHTHALYLGTLATVRSDY
jgi:hypothetical protein